MTDTSPDIRDLIYFDFEKAASLFSQVEGGLLRETRAGAESSVDERNIRRYDLKVFKPELGGQSVEKRSQLEVRVLHHDILGRLERHLVEQGLATDLSRLDESIADDPDKIRSEVERRPYVRATGWSIIEDYERLVGFHIQLTGFS